MSNADKLFRIHRTCYELLEARGYIVARVGAQQQSCTQTWHIPTQEHLERTKEEFIHEYGEDPKRDDLTILAPKQDDPANQVE